MLAPLDIAKQTIKIGQNKASLTPFQMIILGIFAGIFIALAGVGATFGNAYVGKLAGACIFPAGLAMVVVAGSELFTGNNLMIVAFLKKKITLEQLLKNWFFVYLGNFIGAILVAALVVFSGSFDSVADAAITTASSKINLGFMPALIRGIFCNFLVCIAVWMSFAADSVQGKVLAVFFPIMLFVLCGFEHSIANMFYIPAGIFESLKIGTTSLSLSGFIFGNLLPVTIGNIIGGAGLVGLGYYLSYLKK